MMEKVFRSAKLHFWPLIMTNLAAMTFTVGGDMQAGALLGVGLCFLSSFGFLVNDLCDRNTVDRVNKAGRLEGCDAATIRRVGLSALAFVLSALTIFLWLGPTELMIGSLIAVTLLMYSVLLRRMLVLPTLVTAVVASSPLWIPLLLWGNPNDAWKWSFVMASLLTLSAREIIIDILDMEGDRAGVRATLPTVFGDGIARFVGVVLTVSGWSVFGVIALVEGLDVGIVPQSVIAVSYTGITYLLVWSVLAILMADRSRSAIKEYVLRSRLAMALVPLFLLGLWWR